MNEPFVYSDGQTAHNGEELLHLCKQFPDESLGYLLSSDFEKWLKYIGDRKLVQYAVEARESDVSDAQKLTSFIKKVEYITEPETIRDPSKPKMSFFTLIASFFIVLFGRKDNTEDRPVNT